MKKIAHLLAALLLCSCTIVNSGHYVDNIGHNYPEVKRLPLKDADSTWNCRTPEYETWRVGDLYYVKLPVIFSQRYVPLLQNSSIMPYMDRGTWYYPKNPATAGINRHAYVDSLPHEIYYAELTENQLLACSPVHRSRTANKEAFRLLKAEEIDLSKAKKLENSFIFDPDSLVKPHLNDRRSIGNQIRRPFTWALCVADIPLSLGISAAGLTYELLMIPILTLEDLGNGH